MTSCSSRPFSNDVKLLIVSKARRVVAGSAAIRDERYCAAPVGTQKA